MGSLLGARLGFVLWHWDYYRILPREILQWQRGGLIWEGAVLGGLLVWLALWLLAGEPALQAADRLTRLVVPVAVAVWLACLPLGCAYGLPAQGQPWGLPAPDETGHMVMRIPTQILAALTLLASAILLEWRLPPAAPAGRRAALVILALAINLFLFSFLRGDPLPILWGWRLDSWTAGLFLLLSLTGCGLAFLPRPK
jgi:phosphatidylglycerol:prolipoprotein diacylglycerol transferase